MYQKDTHHMCLDIDFRIRYLWPNFLTSFSPPPPSSSSISPCCYIKQYLHYPSPSLSLCCSPNFTRPRMSLHHNTKPSCFSSCWQFKKLKNNLPRWRNNAKTRTNWPETLKRTLQEKKKNASNMTKMFCAVRKRLNFGSLWRLFLGSIKLISATDSVTHQVFP